MNQQKTGSPKPAPTESSASREGKRTPGNAEGSEKTVNKAVRNDSAKKK
jgi:hypothetical protein